MKTKFKSISLAAMLVLALATVVIAKANSIATVQNNTTNDLGTVAIYVGTTPYYVAVHTEGVFPVNVPDVPTSVVVNSYVIQQGQYGIVTLQSGVKVKVTVSGYIVSTDQQEVN